MLAGSGVRDYGFCAVSAFRMHRFSCCAVWFSVKGLFISMRSVYKLLCALDIHTYIYIYIYCNYIYIYTYTYINK